MTYPSVWRPLLASLLASCTYETPTLVRGNGDRPPGDTNTPTGDAPGDTGVSPDCGNDRLDDGEECDDGNSYGLDACDARCRISLYTIGGTNRVLGDTVWVDVAIRATEPAVFFAIDAGGMVFRSDDSGVTWSRQCAVTTLTSAKETSIFVTPEADEHAYVADGVRVYRVVTAPEGSCLVVADPGTTGVVRGGVGVAAFAIAPTSGDLFVWARNWSTMGRLLRSEDLGTTWSDIGHDTYSNASQADWPVVDPSDEAHLLVARTGGSAGGIYLSTSPGQFDLVSSSQSIHSQIRFDPQHTEFVYSNDGFFSDDGGATWMASTNHIMSHDWAIDETGAGYRLVDSSDQTVVERADDMRSPSWQGLNGGTFASTDLNGRIDATDESIAVILRGELHVSVDGGSSFSRIQMTATNQVVFSSLDSPDGVSIYGVTRAWGVFASRNSGVTWDRGARAGAIPTAVGEAVVRVSPADPNEVIVYNGTTSAYDQSLMVSHDGMVTARESVAGAGGWAVGAAMSVTDANELYLLSDNGTSLTSNDAGETLQTLGSGLVGGLWWPIAGFAKGGAAWIVDSNNDALWELNAAGPDLTNVSDRVSIALADDSVAGLEVYDDGAGGLVHLVISQQGNTARSTDDAVTFAPMSAGEPLPPCTSGRYLRSAPDDRQRLATACRDSYTGVGWSIDGGATWKVASGEAWNERQCPVRGLALTDSALVLACGDGKPVSYILAAPPICGDGVTSLPEICDDGVGNSNDVADACRLNCRPHSCGDGTTDSGEECDDGNANDRDGCTNACTLCGNHTTTPPEECDLGSSNSDAADGSCRTDCRLAGCGDGISDPAEICDDGNRAAGDGCAPSCNGTEDCGDGIVDTGVGEGCDDGSGNNDSVPDACRMDCSGPRCGDGIVDSGEDCDDTNTDEADGCTRFCRSAPTLPPCNAGEAALCFDSVSTLPETSGTALTWSHTVTSAVGDRVLLVAITFDESVTVSGVTFGSQTLTPLSIAAGDPGFEQLQIHVWYQLAPSPGSADIVVVTDNAAAFATAGAQSFGNVLQTSPGLGDWSAARTTMARVDVLGAGDALVVDFVAKEAHNDIAAAHSQIERWNLPGPDYAETGSSNKLTTLPTTMAWPYQCCGDQYVIQAVILRPL